jgi:hypothetical protein
VLSGGFARSELLDAGATVVYESAEELLDHLDEPPFTGVPARAAMATRSDG